MEQGTWNMSRADDQDDSSLTSAAFRQCKCKYHVDNDYLQKLFEESNMAILCFRE